MSSHPKGRDETRPAETASPAARGGVDGGNGPTYKGEPSTSQIGTGSGARRPRPGGPGGRSVRDGGGPDARRLAAAILEVLGGVRSPAEAAEALGVSPPRYYALEARAVGGLIAACEPKPRGRQVQPEEAAARLRRENEKLKRENARQQALVRAAQRAVGLTATPTGASPQGRPDGKGKKRRRRPVVRALRMARELRAVVPCEPPLSSLALEGVAAPGVPAGEAESRA